MNQQNDFTITTLVLKSLGLQIVQKSNWVGKGLIVTRSNYANTSKEREDFNKSGVYLLLGKDEEGGEDKIYIGESETVSTRLKQHFKDKNKEFFEKIIVFTTDGEPLNKAQVKYLEASLLKLTKNSIGYTIVNISNPEFPSLSEADEINIKGYLEEMLSLLPVIGIDIFTPPDTKQEEQEEKDGENIFTFKWKAQEEGAQAKGYETADGRFAVSKDSKARIGNTSSLSKPISRARQRLLEKEGVLEAKNKFLVFTQDYIFNSPSTAAQICSGRPANGREVWKNENGESLNDIEQRKLETSDSSGE